ncbi:mRNA cap guanine-N7 methyltransferase [Batrachochytrium dendrobatidis]
MLNNSQHRPSEQAYSHKQVLDNTNSLCVPVSENSVSGKAEQQSSVTSSTATLQSVQSLTRCEQRIPNPAIHESHSHNNSNATFNSAVVQSHYNARPDKGIEGRQTSAILSLKNFNNWIKSVLINLFAPSYPKGIKILDMCCGKGGDLQKWKRLRVNQVVGLDIADVSIEQARTRYNQGTSQHYPASFYAVDCFSSAVGDILKGKLFDLCSIQFALHYSFETEKQARQAIYNISSHLHSGGILIGTIPNADLIYKRLMEAVRIGETQGQTTGPYTFGNSIYSITFESTTPTLFGHKYQFALADAIDDCPEYLINYSTLKKLAAEYQLEPIMWKPFHNFYQDECVKNIELLERMRIFNHQGTISSDEWEAIGIYSVFAFQKKQ